MRDAVFRGYRGHDRDQVCSDLGVQLEARYNHEVVLDLYSAREIPEVGKLQVTFQGRTVQAICFCHAPRGKCKLTLNPKPGEGITFQQVEADCLSWIAQGTRVGSQLHTDMGDELREQIYGMKLRAKRDSG